MNSIFKGALGLGLLILIPGCHNYGKPDDYGRARPPVDRIDPRDSGLQSKDVVASTDKMAMDLLNLPELNASPTQWTVVVVPPENLTADHRRDFTVFVDRLRVKLSEYGHGKIALVENREVYHNLQDKELEPAANGDRFGQGGNAQGGGGGAGIQPNYALYARIMEMPNRATSYFYCEFALTNLASRQQIWVRGYEVKVQN